MTQQTFQITGYIRDRQTQIADFVGASLGLTQQFRAKVHTSENLIFINNIKHQSSRGTNDE